MTNMEYLHEIKNCICFDKYIQFLGEHGHGHYHSTSVFN